MAVTSGFFNSLNGDRKYNADQFSALFDNLITDGVFSNVGTAFEVQASGGSNVTIGIGRAWFNSIWVYNDALYPMVAQEPEVLLNRIDAVVIEINHNEAVRTGSIRWVYGSPSSTPVKPTLTNTDEVHQYPLAYVYRKAGVSDVIQADITNAIGTSECPYVTGILSTQNIDKIVAQWESQFNVWFDGLEAELSGDVAANLANQVLDLQNRFQTLAREKAVYEELQDSSGTRIQDNNGSDILGKTVLGVSDDMIINYNPGQIGGGDSETFKAGDILTTKRNDLDSSWLLCNGESVNSADYPDLLPFDTSPLIKTYIVKDEEVEEAFSPPIEETSSLEFGNGYYFYGGRQNNYAVIVYSTSINGPWTVKRIGKEPSGSAYTVAYVNGYYTAIVIETDSVNTSRYSTALYYTRNISGSWSKSQNLLQRQTDRLSNDFVGIAYGNGYYVTVRNGGTASNASATGYYCTSLGGAWTTFSPFCYDVYGVKFLNGNFFMYGRWRSSVSSHTFNCALEYFANPADSTPKYLVQFNDSVNNDFYGVFDVNYIDGKYVAYLGSNAFRVSSTLTTTVSSWVLHQDKSLLPSYDDDNYITSYEFLYVDGTYIFVLNDYSALTDAKITVYFSESLDGPWTSWQVYTRETYRDYDLPRIMYLRFYQNQYVFSGYSSKDNANAKTLLYMWPDTSKIALPSISLSEDTYTYIKVKE